MKVISSAKSRKITIVRILGISFLAILGSAFFAAEAQVLNKDLKALTDAENAFAKRAFDASVKTAFLENLDRAGMVFEGDIPVLGLTQYSNQAANQPNLITWYPVFAQVAASGELGFSCGPYKYQADRTKPVTGSGYYFSIWKRNAEGAFKVMLDAGTHHTKLDTDAFVLHPKPQREITNFNNLPTVKNISKKDPWDIETLFSEQAENDPEGAYQKFAAKRFLMIRNDHPAGQDKTANLELIRQQNISAYKFGVAGKGVSLAGDLAYCYGQVKVLGDALAEGYFVRVWQFQKDGWRILADEISVIR
jgi:ketosteroid isomerase-like protein